MKPFFHFLPAVTLCFVFASCSSSGNDENKTMPNPVAVAAPKPDITTLQTDTGRLEIRKQAGNDEAEATLYGEDGKRKASGTLLNGKPAGAWVHYDENGNVVSAEHLSADGKVLHQLDKNDFVFRTWENKMIGVKISVPKNWKELPSPNENLLASFEKEVKDTAVHIKPNFNIARAKLQPGDSLAKLAAIQLQMQHSSYGHIEVVEESNFIVDSCKAFRRYGMYYTENNKVGFLDAIIVSGNTAWFFSCEAQNREEGEFLLYQGVFQHIVDSFERVN